MLSDVSQTLAQEDFLYDNSFTNNNNNNNFTNRVALFISQLFVLLWKEYLTRVRQPVRTLVDIFAPALLILVLSYAIHLSPSPLIDSFEFLKLPEVSLNTNNIPNETNISLNFDQDVLNVMSWSNVLNELNLTSFFMSYIVSVAKLHNITQTYNYNNNYYFNNNNNLWSSSWNEREVTHTLLSNFHASFPFKIPTFDAYISMISNAKILLGEKGMKRTMFSDPLIYFIFHFGKLAFVLGDEVNISHRETLLIESEKLIEFMNVTNKYFNSKLICNNYSISSNKNMCTFDSVNQVIQLLLSSTKKENNNEILWAIIKIDDISRNPPKFKYSILINETIMKSFNIIEEFPQGLGKDYANYAYNGFLTLQYELNNYFTSLVETQKKRENISLITFVDFICSTINTSYNATKEIFIEPAEKEKKEIIKNASLRDPILNIISKPFTDMNAIDAPCIFEVNYYCFNSNDSTSILKCLNHIKNNKNLISKVCYNALNFIEVCLSNNDSDSDNDSNINSDECNINNTYNLLTNIPSILPKCALSIDTSCEEIKYIQNIEDTKSIMNCYSEFKKANIKFNCINNIFAPCNAIPIELVNKVSKNCRSILNSILPCSDEYQSICPFKKLDEKDSIPYKCLYENNNIISSSCKETEFIKDILPNLYTYKAIRERIPVSNYYCHEVHDIKKSLENSITVQAFPTKGYKQEIFFLTGGPFVGLIIAISYYFPFAATIQSISRERETWQHKYLIIIGTHPMAILLSKLLTSFIISIIISLFVTVAVMFSLDVSSSIIYSLLYMYSLSLSGLAVVIGAIIQRERIAILITPFIFFLFITPAFINDKSTELYGLSTLLPPTVLANFINEYSKTIQSNYLYISRPIHYQKTLWILFGLGILYGVIAILLEYLFIPQSSLHRLFKRYTAYLINFIDNLLNKRNIRVKRYFEREELSSNYDGYLASGRWKTKRDNTNKKREDNKLNKEFNIGGINNKNSFLSNNREENILNMDIPSEEELIEIQPPIHNDTIASLISPNSQEFPTPSNNNNNNNNNNISKVPHNWQKSITIRHLSYTIIGKSCNLQIPYANFYKNQLNCLVGAAGSGKSLLLNLLMCWSDLPQGEAIINGKKIWEKGRVDIGICLEKSVLWEHLTVIENIRMIQLIKGRYEDFKTLQKEEDILLSALQLSFVRHEKVNRLSSGMKRKLSVAMAFAGGSRILLLDEPTISTDISSKYEIWHLISQNIKSRCIIVATSDMEQVNYFADYITILFAGKIRLSGTPEYIRWKLNGGWVITICRALNININNIFERVLSISSHILILSNVGNEISFRVTDNLAKDILPPLLTELQHMRESGIITNINVSDAPLTEAFVRFTRILTVRENQERNNNNNNISGANGDYVMMPPYNQNQNIINENEILQQEDEYDDSDNDINFELNSNEENRNSRNKKEKIFFGFYAIFSYRFFEAVLAPLYDYMTTLLPLLMILFATGLMANNFYNNNNNNNNNNIFKELSLLDWEISSSTSNTFYMDFSESISPYQFIIENFQNKIIPGTSSIFLNISNTEIPFKERNSVAMNKYLQKNGFLTHKLLFGAFSMQNPIIKNIKNESFPNVFPWLTDVILYNTSYPLTLPVYVQLLGMMRLWVVSNNTKGIISTSIGQLKQIKDFNNNNNYYYSPPSTSSEVMSTLLLLLPFAFYGSRMVADLVEKRRSGFLQVLYTSSLKPQVYWIANFTYDLFAFLVLSLLGISIYFSSGIAIGFNFKEVILFIIFMMILGCGTISLSYILSKFFNNPTNAQFFITTFVIFTGFTFLIASSVVRFLPNNPLTISAKEKNENYSSWMRFLPLFVLGEDFLSYSMSQLPFSNMKVEFPILQLMFLPLMFILLILYESFIEVNVIIFVRDNIYRNFEKIIKKIYLIFSKSFINNNNTFSDDNDNDNNNILFRWEDPSSIIAKEDLSVTEERRKGYTADGFHINEIWKRHHNVYAIQHLTFNIEGETLAVIGINGSGKTTLLQCLSGEIIPSFGNIFMNGLCATRGNISKLNACSQIGYTPEYLFLQNSTITPFLFLNIIADLRGMPRGLRRKKHIYFILKTLGLILFQHISIYNLHISLQRRLGLAVALINFPSLLLLDNITNSLDVISQRYVWALLHSVPASTSILISTHHSNEIEMICNKVLHLDEGMMQFIGTPAEFREKYRKGITVGIHISRLHEAWVRSNIHYMEDREILQKFFTFYWQNSILVSSQPYHYIFHIPSCVFNTNNNKSSSRRREEIIEEISIHSVLSKLIKARSEGWRIPEENNNNNNNNPHHSRYCSITVSETSMEDTVINAFSESMAFKNSAQNLYDKNVYVQPRDFSTML